MPITITVIIIVLLLILVSMAKMGEAMVAFVILLLVGGGIFGVTMLLGRNKH